MSRSINEIQQSILNAKDTFSELDPLQVLTENENATLENLNSSSRVSIWRQFIFIVSVGIFDLEELWDAFKRQINILIANSRIHTRGWYREKALAFRFGQDLIRDTDRYDDTGLELATITASKIIKHASVTKVIISGYGALRVKVAKDAGADRVPLNATELAAFNYYMNEVADGGTTIFVASLPADMLKLQLVVYYDPLVLDTQGRRLDGTNNTPVIDELQRHLKSIEFDGEYYPAEMERELRVNVEGVNSKATSIRNAWSKYGGYNYTTTDVVNVGLIDEIRTAESGYMKLDLEAINITYVPRSNE